MHLYVNIYRLHVKVVFFGVRPQQYTSRLWNHRVVNPVLVNLCILESACSLGTLQYWQGPLLRARVRIHMCVCARVIVLVSACVCFLCV